MKENFRKEHGMLLRTTPTGDTLYSNLTVNDEYLIHALQVESGLTGKTPAKLLGKFVKRAWDAGIELKP